MTRTTNIHEGLGARLDKVELMNGHVVVDTSYALHSPRSPVAKEYHGRAEAQAAYLAELATLSL